MDTITSKYATAPMNGAELIPSAISRVRVEALENAIPNPMNAEDHAEVVQAADRLDGRFVAEIGAANRLGLGHVARHLGRPRASDRRLRGGVRVIVGSPRRRLVGVVGHGIGCLAEGRGSAGSFTRSELSGTGRSGARPRLTNAANLSALGRDTAVSPGREPGGPAFSRKSVRGHHPGPLTLWRRRS